MQVDVKGNIMTIAVTLDAKGRPSSTGKMLLHYSSGGFATTSTGHKINLTVGKPNK